MTTIETVKPDEPMYVRIFPCSITPIPFVRGNINRVAKVEAVTDTADPLSPDMVFIELDGETKVIDKKDVQFITEKEYFAGMLKHG